MSYRHSQIADLGASMYISLGLILLIIIVVILVRR